MSLNAYTGWGISTALLWLMNKRSNKDTSSQQDPSNLSVNTSVILLMHLILKHIQHTLILMAKEW